MSGNNREYIAPLVVDGRWVYWLEQLQADGSLRGYPVSFRAGVRAWRTDQTYIGNEQMTGMVTERDGGGLVTLRSAVVAVSTPTRAQYDAWQAANQLVPAGK